MTRRALERSVLDALQRPPCGVSFSGGKDSSALLALALAVARREGLDEPVPLTLVPRYPEGQEEEWQRLVLADLGVSEQVTVHVDDELEALGQISTRFLKRHGLRYPWNTHFHQPLLAHVAGGSVITGSGGDELFDPFHWSRLTELRRHPTRVRPRDWQHLAGAALPTPLRARILARRWFPAMAWLTPAGARSARTRVGMWLGSAPRSPRSYLSSWWWRSRYLQRGIHSLELLGSDEDVLVIAPFAEADVVAGFANERESYSLSSREDAMCQLFGDLLPAEVLRRRSKADFSRLNSGPRTAEFVQGWEPKSVDPALVEPGALRDVWTDDVFLDLRSIGLLKQEWLAHNRDGRAQVA